MIMPFFPDIKNLSENACTPCNHHDECGGISWPILS